MSKSYVYNVKSEQLEIYLMSIKRLCEASSADCPEKIEGMDNLRRKAHNKIVRDFKTWLEKTVDEIFE